MHSQHQFSSLSSSMPKNMAPLTDYKIFSFLFKVMLEIDLGLTYLRQALCR